MANINEEILAAVHSLRDEMRAMETSILRADTERHAELVTAITDMGEGFRQTIAGLTVRIGSLERAITGAASAISGTLPR